ncbi:MAG: hypothetical protein QM775_12835 [Pirellulales bacterium]
MQDLIELLELQLAKFGDLDGGLFNVGGGLETSLSLVETTKLCEEIIGRKIDIGTESTTREGDVRVYITDNAKVTAATGWQPRRSARTILSDIHQWVVQNEAAVKQALG